MSRLRAAKGGFDIGSVLTSLSCTAILAVFLACGGEAESATYSARGVVRQIGKEIYIAHESIPEFQDARGNVVGMPAMAMPFALASPDLGEGLAPGTKISFEFVVRWRSSPALEVTAITALAEGTPLDLTSTGKHPPQKL